MRKLVVNEFLSLDGVMQAPGHPEEDRSGGFTHGGWQLPYVDDVFGEVAAEGIAETDAYLFGRRTYEIMAGLLAVAARRRTLRRHAEQHAEVRRLHHARRTARVAELDPAPR